MSGRANVKDEIYRVRIKTLNIYAPDDSEEEAYAIVEVPGSLSLYQLADVIVDIFYLEPDHLFGFFDRKSPEDATVGFEFRQIFLNYLLHFRFNYHDVRGRLL